MFRYLSNTVFVLCILLFFWSWAWLALDAISWIVTDKFHVAMYLGVEYTFVRLWALILWPAFCLMIFAIIGKLFE